MVKEIGSHFHWTSLLSKRIYSSIEDSQFNIDNFRITRNVHEVLVSTGRQAIDLALKDIENEVQYRGRKLNKVALLPSYTCYSVIDPFIKSGYRVYFYPVKEDMTVKISEINRLITALNPMVFLFHPYFGFPTVECDQNLFKDELYVIYDNTQSWLSNIEYPFVDYTICSLRKWGALPDGAYVTKENGRILCDILDLEDSELVDKYLDAYRGKDLYLTGKTNTKEPFLSDYVEGNNLVKNRKSIYKMEYRSKHALRIMFEDMQEIKKARRSNFNLLRDYPHWSKFGELPFKELDLTHIPLYFPLRVNMVERERLQFFLAEKSVYCPIIWPKPNNIDIRGKFDNYETTTMLQNQLLCFPIDQRYSQHDMERITSLLDAYV